MEHAMMLRQRSEETFEDYHAYSMQCKICIGVLFITFDMFHSNVIALCECALSAVHLLL